jgi:hypothetical protein
VNVIYGKRFSPKQTSRKVFNINNDNQTKYEEMKVAGTLESSDEEDEDENPFVHSQNKDMISKNKINQNPLQRQSMQPAIKQIERQQEPMGRNTT